MVLLGTFFYCFGSALIPVLNAEVYIAAIAASDQSAWLVALVAAAGQMVGKLLWYALGAGSTRIPRIARKLDEPKWKASYERWHARTDGRPWYTTFLLALSGFSGFPPFAIVSVLAGVLRIRVVVFLAAGLLGRFARFWVIAAGADQILSWMPWH